jgi:tetraacyldisaccharide 4'-kinase
MSEWHQRLWSANTPAYRALSALLTPAELAYRAGVAVRAWMYDRGILTSMDGSIPTLAVGNLTVGGTGKTPVTAWFAGALAARGLQPAVVMRGYGGDEIEVHRLLNPSVPVHASADRVEGVRRAQQGGAEVVVLDDAFQHRALRADAYVVLVAAEEWTASPRLLPRGPWREPLAALRRATLIVTTRKVASRDEALQVTERLAELYPSVPTAEAHIGLAGLARYDGATGVLGKPAPAQGFRCALAVAGVARPGTVFAQLEEAGVTADEAWGFSDHHRYGREEVDRIAERYWGGPLVATLKDAVKLGAALEPGVELYVPLQTVDWESGREEVDRLMSGFSSESR